MDSASDFAHQARVTIAPRAADAGAHSPMRLVEHDAARCVIRVIASRREVVRQLLDPGFVGDRRPWVLLAPVSLGRILAVAAVHLVELLGLRIPRLEVVVGQRPGGGDAVDVLQLTEVLGPQPVQGGSVQLRRAADVVVDLRLEGLAIRVVPGLGRDVPSLDEYRIGVPVLALSRKEVPAFDEQDLRSRWSEGVRKRAPTRAGADDDHVVALRHRCPLPSAAWPRRTCRARGSCRIRPTPSR